MKILLYSKWHDIGMTYKGTELRSSVQKV